MKIKRNKRAAMAAVQFELFAGLDEFVRYQAWLLAMVGLNGGVR